MLNFSSFSWTRTLTVLGSGVAVFAPLFVAISMASLIELDSQILQSTSAFLAIPIIGFFFVAYIIGEIAISIGELILGFVISKMGKEDRLYGSFDEEIDPFDDMFLFVIDLKRSTWTREYEIVRNRIEGISGLAGALMVGGTITFVFVLAVGEAAFRGNYSYIYFMALGSFLLGACAPFLALILTRRFESRLRLFSMEEKLRKDAALATASLSENDSTQREDGL